MNKYRTHNCSELSEKEIDKIVYLSGWLHRKRDHGNLLFVDLRDHYGITQCVIENNNKSFPILEKSKPESVLKISGKVVKRTDGTENLDLKTGKIEIAIESIEVLSMSLVYTQCPIKNTTIMGHTTGPTTLINISCIRIWSGTPKGPSHGSHKQPVKENIAVISPTGMSNLYLNTNNVFFMLAYLPSSVHLSGVLYPQKSRSVDMLLQRITPTDLTVRNG